MPIASRRNGRERRDAILDAALQCFTRKGVLETGIEDVRKAAGASPSSVYHLFDGMTDIVLALLLRTFERLYGALVTATITAQSAEELVRAGVTAHLGWVLANRGEARFMYQAMALELAGPARQQIDRKKTELKAPMIERLGRLLAGSELAGWPPHALEVVMFGPTHQACRYLLAGGDLDVEWMRQMLPTIAWRALEAAATPATAKTTKRARR